MYGNGRPQLNVLLADIMYTSYVSISSSQKRVRILTFIVGNDTDCHLLRCISLFESLCHNPIDRNLSPHGERSILLGSLGLSCSHFTCLYGWNVCHTVRLQPSSGILEFDHHKRFMHKRQCRMARLQHLQYRHRRFHHNLTSIQHLASPYNFQTKTWHISPIHHDTFVSLEQLISKNSLTTISVLAAGLARLYYTVLVLHEQNSTYRKHHVGHWA